MLGQIIGLSLELGTSETGAALRPVPIAGDQCSLRFQCAARRRILTTGLVSKHIVEEMLLDLRDAAALHRD